MKKMKMPPIHPGEVLIKEFLKPMNITQYRLAKDISVPPRRINENKPFLIKAGFIEDLRKTELKEEVNK